MTMKIVPKVFSIIQVSLLIMMTDQLREERDMFPTEEFTITAGGDESRKLFEYEAVSGDYSELWNGFYVGMDRTAHEVLYTTGDESVERFSYGE